MVSDEITQFEARLDQAEQDLQTIRALTLTSLWLISGFRYLNCLLQDLKPTT
jgi:hypothetical protein